MILDEYITKNTPSFCQEAMIEVLEELFDGLLFEGQETPKKLSFYAQTLPIPTTDDEEADKNSSVAPFVIVAVNGGEVPDEISPQYISMSLMICIYDSSTRRHGWTEVQNVKERIVQHFCGKPYFGNIFTVLKPIEWALQEDDTAPYYWGVVNLTATAPAMTTDTELEKLL